MNKGIKKALALTLAVFIGAAAGEAGLAPAFAAEANKTDQTENDKDLYKLDKEVQKWLDEGNSIPGEAKYATLSGTGHLWAIDSNDISDGKVELTGNDEVRELYGLSLKNWLKTQFFYGDQLGKDDNRKKFLRPGNRKETL